MTPRAWTTIALVAALLLSACMGAPGGDDNADPKARLAGGSSSRGALGFAADWAEMALVGGAEHSHRDPTQHENRSTPNFETLGYNPLITDYYGRTAGDHGCGDTREKDGKRLSITHSFGTDIAFVVADVTDPKDPKKVGEMVMANTQVYDLALSPDLKWVVLATSPMDAGPSPGGQAEDRTYAPGELMWRDACTGQETPVPVLGPEGGLPYASGNVLIDLSNPRNPTVVDFLMYPVLGAHSVTITEVKGKLIVLSSVPNIPDQASFYVFMEIRALPAGAKLVPLSTYQHPVSPIGPLPVQGTDGMHDGIIAKHPITGKFVAYLAHGAVGLVTLDVEDPASPKLLGAWGDWKGLVGAAAPEAPYVHEAAPAPEAWDGKHYTFIGEECIGHPPKTPTCLVATLDTTDPAKPKAVSAWTLPVDVQWTKGLEFSLHYLALVNRTLFVTVYHGGVWAVDVSTDEALATMPSIGVYLPSMVSPKKFNSPPRGAIVQRLYGGYALEGTPTVLDLNPMSDGNLVVFDMQSGLYTVRFDAANPAPAPEPWPFPL